jgi:trk system potassium uptake protein TrkA
MNVIVGCGRFGSALAYQLCKTGHRVTVIDQDPSAFDHLPVDFQGRTIEGDVLARDVLHRAQIEEADALAAFTNSDTLNALVAHVARTEYQVSKVVAGNANPRQRPLQEAFGIPVVGAASWGAQRVVELISDAPLRAIPLDGNTKVAIYQLEVPESWRGHALQELLPEDRIQPLALARAGQPLPVSGAQTLDTGDLIYLSAGPGRSRPWNAGWGFGRSEWHECPDCGGDPTGSQLASLLIEQQHQVTLVEHGAWFWPSSTWSCPPRQSMRTTHWI